MNKKATSYLILFLLFSGQFFAQTFNNEWINFSQKYYKIKIGNDGLYKLDSASLTAAGIPIATFSPKNIQLFQKGKEIYPYIFGEADDTLNTNDYILFYAENNSGEDDSLLYDNVPYLTNPYYSVINDTGAVFFTWNGSTANHRLKLDTDTSYSSYNASPYYYKEVVTSEADYSFGPLNIVNQSDPRYKLSEGITALGTPGISDGTNFQFPFITSSAYTTGIPLAYATVCFSGSNDLAGISPDHLLQIQFQGNAGLQTLANVNLNGYQSYKNTYAIPPSSFGSNPFIQITSQTNPVAPFSNDVNVNYIRVIYPQQFNLQGQSQEKMYLPDDPSQLKSKLTITNFANASAQVPVLIDLTNNTFFTVTAQAGGIYNTLVPNTNLGINRVCYLSSWASVNYVTAIKPVNGTGNFVSYSTVPDSAFVIVTHPKIMVGATAYQSFRQSTGYNTLLASISDLYDQFAFGVELNPLSIRNFCAYLIKHANKPPSNLFLIGKGIHSWECLPGVIGSVAQAAAESAQNLVPSFGYPPSDILITQGLPGSSVELEPAIPTGRLAAQTDQDVLNYLSKAQLQVQQTADTNLWQKHAIHFIGGDDAGQQQTFDTYMSGFKRTFQDTSIGGQVYTFYKTSATPISITTNDSVEKLINEGVSLMTFFGHGSPTGFDQNIDAPGAYNNSPRFPLILANSCFTGDIYSYAQPTNSEDWVLAPNNHGAIGYIATVSEGVANDLDYFSQELYNQFSYKSYGMPYGYCIKNAIKTLMKDVVTSHSAQYADSILLVTCMEMTLHGDPAIKMFTEPKPDYTLKNADVIFNTSQSISPDSIGIKIVMTNLGKAIRKTYSVYIERTFPNGDTVGYFKTVLAPLYKDTLKFNIYKNPAKATGLNNFYVKLDHANQISEINETNNATAIGQVKLFIQGADIDPVWPYEYAIVPNISKVILKASTADPFVSLNNYRFQVDTNGLFLNPLVNTTVQSLGGVVQLPVNLLNIDSTVYFWRVAKDSTVPNWKSSSFQVIKSKYGWEQAHYDQFNNDQYQFVKYNKEPVRRFDFVNDIKSIDVKTGIFFADNSISPIGYTQTQFFYNNGQVRLWGCGIDGWSIAIFDPSTANIKPSHAVSWVPQAGLTATDSTNGSNLYIGNAQNCICDGITTKYTYDFGLQNQCFTDGSNDSLWESKLVALLTDTTLIPYGTPVLAYTVKEDYGGIDSANQLPLTSALIHAFNNIGSSQISNLKDTTELIIFGRKGMLPGQAHEALSTYKTQYLQLIDSLKTNFNHGFIRSEIIGPASRTDTAWKSFHWRYTSLESPSADSIVIQLIGIDTNGLKTPLANFTNAQLDVLNLSTYANAKIYPYLQLIAYEADNTNHTPPQLKRWQVIFDPVPEAAIDPPLGFNVLKRTLQEGDNLQVRVPIKNISDMPFTDSLAITYYVQDANRNNHIYPYQLKRRPFLPDSVLFDTISVNTLGLAGGNILWIDVNPPGKPKYQLEQFHFNNIAQVAFNVNKDNINPLLDVTFDGTHILNGDIVSAKPNILVSLKDENKYLALNDTADFAVYVTTPTTPETRIHFNSSTLMFTPAVLPNNSCKINYTPVLAQDGMYTLHIKATDRTGNISGQFDYRIQYEVINKPMVTEVLNYPNPFSTSTKFVFTITGSEVPETFKIQIMTITGKVVKEITREELGYIHIGRNITEYAWDGTDQYGGKLANGVYLYHVVTRLHGNTIEHLNTSADQFFKKDIGKMVIMR